MQDELFMRRAIELAARGAGYVAPNPMVGAVLAHEGRIIGEGWHAVYGDIHAEVACLQSVHEADKPLIPQSTMYVTLEPCAHQGRQPPCAQRLVKEEVRRVVVAVEDPFPEVSGRGIAILRDAGIAVTVGCCSREARWMCRRFLNVQETGRPYVILKWAASADGCFAPQDGSRHQMSNYFSQVLVHKWRTEEPAIMVGYNTALADNPQLTARFWSGPQPLRIALDRGLQLPAAYHLLDDSIPTWIIHEQEQCKRDGITQQIRLPFNDGLLPALLSRLAEAKKTSLFVEGGARLLNSFIAAGLWDEARVFTTSGAMPGAGIPVPKLPQATAAFRASVGDDTLDLYQRAGSRFPYVAGAVL